MEKFIESSQYINCNGKLLNISEPKIMGILNITPDSFFDGGKYHDQDAIIDRIQNMLTEGADIIDIGAYSSRPGAVHITVQEEKQRLASALQVIRKKFPEIIISIDTFRSEIAQFVVEEYGVDIINDISAGEMDKKMFDTVELLNVPYIMMHMKGTPQDMQNKPDYEYDVVYEIIDYFSGKVEELKQRGVHDIIIDPGFGFGKTLDHNYELLNRMKELQIFELPLLIGLSRKSMIYNLLDSDPQKALNGTSILNMVSLQNGASIIRVHDVKEAKECVTLFNKLQSVKNA